MSAPSADLLAAVEAGTWLRVLEIDLPDSTVLRSSEAGYSSVASGHYVARVKQWGSIQEGWSDDGLAAPETYADLADPAGELAALIAGEYSEAFRDGSVTCRIYLASPAVPRADWYLLFSGVVVRPFVVDTCVVRWPCRVDDAALASGSTLRVIGPSWPRADADTRTLVSPLAYGRHDGGARGLTRGQIPTIAVDPEQLVYIVCGGVAQSVIRAYDDDGVISAAEYSVATDVRAGWCWTTLVFSTAPNGAVTVDVAGVGDVSTAAQPVVWTNAVGVTVTGASLSKPGSTTAWDSGASSVQQLTGGDGYLEWVATETTTYRGVGLGTNDANQNYTDLEWAILTIPGGTYTVYESGVAKTGSLPFSAGDTFRLRVKSGVVQVLRNGTPVYTSAVPPTYPLWADTSIYSSGGTVTNAVVSGFTGIDTIQNAATALAHLLTNGYWGTAAGQAWLATSARLDATTLAAIEAWLDDRLYGSDGVSFYTGTDGRGGADVVREWMASVGVYVWWKAAGTLAMGVFPTDGDPYTTVATLHWQRDDLSGRWSEAPDDRRRATALRIQYAPSATGGYLESLELADPEAARDLVEDLVMPWSFAG